MILPPNIMLKLRAFKDLNSMDKEDLVEFLHVLRPFQAPASEELLRYGIREKYYFLLLKGEVTVSTQILNLDVVLHKIVEHQSFGHGALVKPSTNLKFVTTTPCELLVLPSYVHILALEQGKSWALQLQKSICFQVIRQMRSTLVQLSSLAAQEKENALSVDEKRLINLLKQTEISTGEQ